MIHSTHPSDTFWGPGLFPHQKPDLSKKLPGKNNFGTLLMELRPIIDSIPYVPATPMDFFDLGATVVLLQDGEKIARSVRYSRPVQSSTAGPERPPPLMPPVQSFCSHCGVRGHVVRVCRLRHREVKCYSCNTIGHKKRYCPFYNNMFFSNQNARNRTTILPTPIPSYSTSRGSNYSHHFPPLPSQSHSTPNFR